MSLRGRDTHLGAGELSHAQFQLLIELYERGELPAGELASAAQLAPATVTQMLDHLAACGHVERARSGADRRVVVSRLTPRGRRRVRARRDAWRRRWERALAGIDERDLRAAARVLERLCEVFEHEPPGDGARASRAGSPAASHAPSPAPSSDPSRGADRPGRSNGSAIVADRVGRTAKRQSRVTKHPVEMEPSST
jgi:DNA-binding MarR family transcriptional regulator